MYGPLVCKTKSGDKLDSRFTNYQYLDLDLLSWNYAGMAINNVGMQLITMVQYIMVFP